MIHGSRNLSRVAALLLMLALPAAASAKNLALLVGVGKYEAATEIRSLEGPASDVAALADVLERRWGFARRDITTLVDAQASRQAILGALDRLADISVPGDEILIFYSGHGTSNSDPRSRLPIPDGSGAILPWDGRVRGVDERKILATLIVGRWDIKPRLQRLAGRKVLVVYDTCFSGNAVRGSQGPARYQPMDTDQQDAALLGDSPSLGYTPPPEWTYDNVAFIAAAAEREMAWDIPASQLGRYPTVDGRPHGHMTDALLRILEGRLDADHDGNGAVDHYEVHQTIARFLDDRNVPHHPVLLPSVREDDTRMTTRALFGRRAAGSAIAAGERPRVPPFRVRFGAMGPHESARIRELPGVEIVKSAGPANLVVTWRDSGFHLESGSGDVVGIVRERDALSGRIAQLAWVHRLGWRRLGHNAFRLRLDRDPATRGSVAIKHDYVNFRVTSERDAWLAMLYIDSNGQVAPLYPYHESELVPIKARTPVRIPPNDQDLEVVDPMGTDRVIVMAFERKPAFLERLVGMRQPLDTEGSVFGEIEATLQNERNTAVATYDLITVAGEMTR